MKRTRYAEGFFIGVTTTNMLVMKELNDLLSHRVLEMELATKQANAWDYERAKLRVDELLEVKSRIVEGAAKAMRAAEKLK